MFRDSFFDIIIQFNRLHLIKYYLYLNVCINNHFLTTTSVNFDI